jgi:hypothetical protein
MTYLMVIFVSPLYFLVRGKIGGFILNAILYFLAICCVVSLIFAWVGVIFWLLAVGHASWHLRREFMLEHAEMIAVKMAEVQGQGRVAQQAIVYNDPSDSKKCPRCAELIKYEAKICKHCGHEFGVQRPEKISDTPGTSPEHDENMVEINDYELLQLAYDYQYNRRDFKMAKYYLEIIKNNFPQSQYLPQVEQRLREMAGT